MASDIKKIERSLFLLLLFSIPFQTRVFLWSAGAVEGFNEWQSAFLYGTDLIVLALFGLWLKRVGVINLFHATTRSFREIRPRSFTKNDNDPSGSVLRTETFFYSLRGFLSSVALSRLRRNKFITPTLFLSVLLLLAVISIFSAPYPGVGVYRVLKLAEFIGLFFYTVHILKKIKFEHAALAFVLGGIFQAVIGITQFFAQRSLGLKLLGESPLEAGRSDVAEFIAFGARFMRAYGTFPSPNVLAAYLSLAILFLLLWYLSIKTISQKDRIFSWQAIFLLSFALLLTFSRASIVAFAVTFAFLLPYFLVRSMREYLKDLVTVLAPFFVGVLVMTVMFWPEIYSRIFTTFAEGDFALRERVFFNNLSLQIIADNFMGVGAGNYTLYLRGEFWGLRDSLYQPVHNIFLLAFSELGILGGGIFMLFCAYSIFLGFKAVKEHPKPERAIIFFAFLFIIFSGLFDHFYLTLQQGGLMFWIIAGMLYYYSIEQKPEKVSAGDKNG